MRRFGRGQSGCCPAHRRFGGCGTARVMGQPALLDGKAAVELLGYAPAPGLGGVGLSPLVETSRPAPCLGEATSTAGMSRPWKELFYSLDRRHDSARCGGESVPLWQLCGTALRGERRRCLGLYAQRRRRAGTDAPLLLRRPGGLENAGLTILTPCRRTKPVEFVVRQYRHSRLGRSSSGGESGSVMGYKRLPALVAQGKILCIGAKFSFAHQREPERNPLLSRRGGTN